MLRLNLIWTCCICVLGMAIAPSQDAVIAQPSFQCHTINKTSSQLSQPPFELGFGILPAPRLSLELDPTNCHPTSTLFNTVIMLPSIHSMTGNSNAANQLMIVNSNTATIWHHITYPATSATHVTLSSAASLQKQLPFSLSCCFSSRSANCSL